MALTASRLAYDDCFRILDRAIESKNGIRFRCLNSGHAKRFRSRLHYARAIDRKDNEENFPLDHPMSGKSIYDPLTVQINSVDGTTYLYIRNLSNLAPEIEELSDGEHESLNGDSREVSGEASGEIERVEGEQEAETVSLRRI